MPSRVPPKTYQLLLKTHKLTVFLTVHPSSTIATLKEEALSALTSTVLSSSGVPHIPTAPGDDDDMMGEREGDMEIPRVRSTANFELCKEVKDKGKSIATGSASANVSYKPLDPSKVVRESLHNWETLYIQFRGEDGGLLPVEVSRPSLLDDENDESRRAPAPAPTPAPTASVGKGKRKAPPE